MIIIRYGVGGCELLYICMMLRYQIEAGSLHCFNVFIYGVGSSVYVLWWRAHSRRDVFRGQCPAPQGEQSVWHGGRGRRPPRLWILSLCESTL